mgnify:CR=1 FL=1
MYLNKTFNANMTVKDMALEERPREKMLAQGEKSLSNAELLAIILRTGTKQKNVIDLANYIINKDSQGIRYLQDITIDELCEIDGVGLTKATMIKAALEEESQVLNLISIRLKTLGIYINIIWIV